jgi:hypothetical protein
MLYIFLCPQKSPRSRTHKQQRGVTKVAVVRGAAEVSKCYCFTVTLVTFAQRATGQFLKVGKHHPMWKRGSVIVSDVIRCVIFRHLLDSVSNVLRYLHIRRKFEYTGCFKTSFTTLKEYIHLFRGHVQYFEMS